MNKHDHFILTLFTHGFKARGTTISHIFKGKRTSSVLTYGFLFNLLQYFGLFPTYNLTMLEKSLVKLVNLGYLDKWDHLYQLTREGKIYLEKNKREIADYPHLNGFYYSKWDEEYMEMLFFTSQVISELVHENTSYKPIDNNPLRQNRVKKWVAFQRLNRKELGLQFFNEWEKLISFLPEANRMEAVLLLSGHNQIGKTWEQVTNHEYDDWLRNLLNKKNTLHFIISLIAKNKQDYPCFTSIYELCQFSDKNESAKVTYNLFKNGKSIDFICEQRKLKKSTVHDHLIEFAISDKAFDYSRIILPEQKEQLIQLLEIVGPVQEWSFKNVNEKFPTIDFMNFRFFQIEQVRQQYEE